MEAYGVTTSTYIFNGTLQLAIGAPIPSGYIGNIARPGSINGLTEARVRIRSFLRC
jgi:hypothetical protein